MTGKSYRNVDPAKLNKTIRFAKHIETPRDLIAAYDSILAERGEITATQNNNIYKIEAARDVHDDDELAGEKILMTAINQNHLWKVLEIRYSIKFQEGYGHTDWGTERYEPFF
ncbi:hypothetical protein KXQ82_11575 [Mucilaginibacter sp. HMF5004]|uniref:hypothetical protein n=1 Tax=Mucilaginibacter rivuli TaxID=2857527 RepID=UPI001C607304|nr:hypothetical protein [Mucilaginibacter rivuli]MBW4890364.1 hypothetical protein [Mucilaginibacter rivuli]